MKWELKLELGRKLIHLTSILILVIYAAIGQYSTKLALFTLTIILVLLLEFQYLRLDFEKKPRIIKYIEQFRREKEKNHIGGEVYFMMGAIISLAIFDFRIAATAILMTTFGDLTAALIGKRFGTHKVFRLQKTWEGTLSALIINILIGWLLIRSTTDGTIWYLTGGIAPTGNPIWPIIIVMAITATFIEVITNKLDDNLLIPIFSGFNGQLVLIILTAQVIPI